MYFESHELCQKWTFSITEEFVENFVIILYINLAPSMSSFPIIRSRGPEVFCEKGILKIFIIFTGKHLCWSLLQACNFIKKRFQHRYFPVNIAKFLRAPIFRRNHWTAASLYQSFPVLSSIRCNEFNSLMHNLPKWSDTL